MQGQLQRAVAARGVTDDAPASGLFAHPVVSRHGIGEVLGEELLGLRTTRDVHALRVPRRRDRRPHHDEDHRLHLPVLGQLVSRLRIVQALDERRGGARVAGEDRDRRESAGAVARLEVLGGR